MHKDLESVLRTIERSQPIFLYCQSLGAALGMSFCIANPTLNLQGVIVVNPYLQLAKKYGFLKKLLLKLANLVVPVLSAPYLGLDDQLVHGLLSLQQEQLHHSKRGRGPVHFPDHEHQDGLQLPAAGPVYPAECPQVTRVSRLGSRSPS